MDSYLRSGIVVCTNAWKYPGKRPVCISEENVIELAKAQGIKLSPLSKFYYEKKAGIENTYVMNYSSVDMERIGKIVRGLEKIC